MQIGGIGIIESIVGLIVPLVILGLMLFALYWIIRKAVKDGINDTKE